METQGRFECCFCFIIIVFLHAINGQNMAPMNSLEQRIATLEIQGKQQVKELHAIITEQNRRLLTQEELITALENKVEHQNTLIIDIRNKLMMPSKPVANTQATEVKESPIPTKGQKRRIKPDTMVQSQIQLSDQQKVIRQNRIVMEGPVAFQAGISNTNISHIGIGQKLVFDEVFLDVGGGYHNQHGLFIAPQAGIYIFSTSVMSFYKPHNIIWVGIYKNGVRIAGAFAYGDNDRDQGSVTVAAQLAVGDEVWVRLDGVADDSLWGQGFSSFMGCMVMYI